MKKYFGMLIIFFTLQGDTPMEVAQKFETVIFAGGCFWCSQAAFEKLDGIKKIIVGYTNGTNDNPTYQNYAKKGHLEAAEVIYDPTKLSYEQLLSTFWRNINPTDAHGQFADRGPQYRSAIFYHNEAQKQQALASKKQLEKSKKFAKPIVTEIIKETLFYKAENYHQGCYKKNPIRYKLYYYFSGRDKFFKKVWNNPVQQTSKDIEQIYKKPPQAILKKELTPLQYTVTQKNKIEPPFANEYWDNKRAGIYVDIVSGEPLFSSLDKFKSGTGWPSFTKPLESENIVLKKNKRWLGRQIEIRSKHADSHLGDLLHNGPPPEKLYYCINSAALKFIPIENLEKEDYGEYKKIFG